MDLGKGFSIKFTGWKPDRELNPKYKDTKDEPRMGAILTCRHGVEGSILFDNEVSREFFTEQERWLVTSWEPLTMEPSIDTGCCHGFIRYGEWVD